MNIDSSIALLQRFIQYPTISSMDIMPFATELAERAERLGGKVHRFQSAPTKQNVVVQLGPEENALGLCGHMDVVPVDGQPWDCDPFKGIVQDSKLIGRGSCDMKGFIALCYDVIAELDFKKSKKGIALIWTHDEEIGCVGAQQLPQQLQTANIQIPKHILIGEPTSQQICHHHGGHSTLEIEIRGKAAHSSKPHLGLSASDWLWKVAQVLQEWQQWLKTQPSPISGETPLLNIGEIHSGSAVNIIPDQAKIKMGFRPMPGHNTHLLIQYLREALQPLQREIQSLGGNIALSIPQNAPPLYTDLPHPLEQKIQHFASTKCIGVPFATDGGCLTEIGCEPIICGPGSIDVAHQANEYVTVQELSQYKKLLHQLMVDWCF